MGAFQAPVFSFGSLTAGASAGVLLPPPSAAFVQGIDFRASAGFVTDPVGYDAELGIGPSYPRSTAQGYVVGWEEAASSTVDGDNAVDPRLAGCTRLLNNSRELITYRLDVPPGNYSLRLALGDMTNVQRHFVTLLDGSTDVAVIADDLATQAGYFYDAVQGQTPTPAWYSAAEWPSKNEPYSFTCSSGVVRLQLGTTAGALGATSIATLLLAQV